MKTFDALPVYLQICFGIFLLLSAMFLLFRILSAPAGQGSRNGQLPKCVLLLLLIYWMSRLGNYWRDTGMGLPLSQNFRIPAVILVISVLLADIYLAWEMLPAGREGGRIIGPDSIKEAIDTLPDAVCFFLPNGEAKLCNYQMYRLFYDLSGVDLQNLTEFREKVRQASMEQKKSRDSAAAFDTAGGIYLTVHDRVWQHHEYTVETSAGHCTEEVFSDVTLLHERRQTLERQVEELQKMRGEMKELSDNVEALAREKELLAVKTRLHDQLGAGLILVRRTLQGEMPPEESEDAFRTLWSVVYSLDGTSSEAAVQDDIGEFFRDAELVGVRVELEGEIPAQSRIREIFQIAARETLTNSVRHGEASVLKIEITHTDDIWKFCFRNNGKPAEGDVIPKGGLKNVMHYVQSAGGEMQIAGQPEFELRITLPSRQRERAGQNGTERNRDEQKA